MPTPDQAQNLPNVKCCEHCGAEFSRDPRYGRKIWARIRFCSPSCASSWNNLNRQRDDVARFWSMVDRSPGQGPKGECWHWTAGTRGAGYGRFNVKLGVVPSHRRAYELAIGPIPDGMMVCHDCDNPPCCNPSHLFIGTAQDNMDDKVAKNRHTFGEAHPGSKLTEADVIAIRADSRMQIEIAAAYGVTQGMIGHIKRGEAWKHLA